MRARLSARWVLAFENGGHVLIEDGEVVLDGHRVVSVGAATKTPCVETIDYGEALLAPGFVDLNALADVDCTILRYDTQAAPKASLHWSRAFAHRSHDALSADDMVAGARGAFAQLLLSGITTALPVTSLLHRAWAESAAEFERIAALADELGIRLVLGPSFRSAVNVVEADGSFSQLVDEERGARGLAEAIAFAESLGKRGHPLASPLLVPSTIETCSDDLLRRTAEAARDLSLPFRLHCCQSELEAELVWSRSGRTSIGHLASVGALSPRALLPHAVELGGPQRDGALAAADLDAFASSGAVLVHCPLVVGRGGRRLESFGRCRDRGITIGIGTDTAPPDMLMNLQLGVALARIDRNGAGAGPADYFTAATVGGAAAIGRPDLGRLSPGCLADIVAWDLSRLDVQPIHDPVQALFLMPPGRRARDVWVHGVRVVRDHTLVVANEERLRADMARIFGVLREAYLERDVLGRDWRTLFPPTFRRAGAAAAHHQT